MTQPATAQQSGDIPSTFNDPTITTATPTNSKAQTSTPFTKTKKKATNYANVTVTEQRQLRSTDEELATLSSEMIALSQNIAGVLNNNPPVSDQTIPILFPLIQYDPISNLLTVHPTEATKKIEKGLNLLATSQLLSPTGTISPNTFKQDIKKFF